MEIWIRYDMQSLGTTSNKALYAAALEQVSWIDSQGFGSVILGEHHCIETSYVPAPIVLASALAARTETLRFLVCTSVPLHDPVRIAEDLTVLDNVSGGRVDVAVNLGYAPAEFEMFGVPYKKRAGLAEAAIGTLRAAFTGEPFEYRGRHGQVTPTPIQNPGPPLYVGGAVPASARRAARLGDGFFTTGYSPDLVSLYVDECTNLEKEPGRIITQGGPIAVFVSDDPERTWSQLAPHLILEQRVYARMAMQAAGMDAPMNSPFDTNSGADELAKLPAGQRWTMSDMGKGFFYAVMTPDDCIALGSELAAHDTGLALAPLLGGLDPEIAWESLQLFGDKVAPALREL